MPYLQGSHTRVVLVEFASHATIEKRELDRAIAGGMRRAGLSRATQQVREEIISTTTFKLVSHFAAGKPLEGKLSSLAYKIAYRVAVDSFRRRDRFEKLRDQSVKIADVTPSVEVEISAENGEERLLRQASDAAKARILKAAFLQISQADRAALMSMLDRSDMMPRDTKEQRRTANATSQREKRARDRLKFAVNAGLERDS